MKCRESQQEFKPYALTIQKEVVKLKDTSENEESNSDCTESYDFIDEDEDFIDDEDEDFIDDEEDFTEDEDEDFSDDEDSDYSEDTDDEQ
ncbi:uncharacterized protein LOC127726489 [Mytilus californianus]|uniref:uncharacterized protein LOC127726489 n=1 Tax=Mytilus californianus TaxID=6549 RepID=UPI0022450134|nr:uncharacterized protein LOC127726489 [Mytilus californianus]